MSHTPASAPVATLGLDTLAPAWHSAAQQDYPSACLYMVATPIGNMADISLRALRVLHMADWIACEDTRHTRILLSRLGLPPAAHPLLAVHQHNEAEQAHALLHHLRAGARVAYVSDAGTPGISDPGARLVAAVHQAGLRVLPIPGASALTTLASASAGVAANGLFFAGFAPTKNSALLLWLNALALRDEAICLFEAPHRILALAQALAQHAGLSPRKLTIGRELTKQFETIHTLTCAEFPAYLSRDAQHQKGEFSLLLHAQSPADHAQDNALQATQEAALQQLHQAGLSLKSAVELICNLQPHCAKKALYARALQIWQAA